jgi:hypothetical protein
MASIEFVCTADHVERVRRGDEGKTITLIEGRWAYCPHGGLDAHKWRRIEATSLYELEMFARRRASADVIGR